MKEGCAMKKALIFLLSVSLCFALCINSASADALKSSNWEKAFYLDPFQDPTDEYFIGTSRHLTGTFNSETVTDGTLEAEIRVDAEKICIYLYENGKEKVKNGGYQAIAFPTMIKAANGTVSQFYGEMDSGADCIVIWEDQVKNVLVSEDVPPLKSSICFLSLS